MDRHLELVLMATALLERSLSKTASTVTSTLAEIQSPDAQPLPPTAPSSSIMQPQLMVQIMTAPHSSFQCRVQTTRLKPRALLRCLQSMSCLNQPSLTILQTYSRVLNYDQTSAVLAQMF